MEAVALDGAVDLLCTIRDRKDTSLAILSGRPVDEIIYLMGDLGITIVGSHGWEVRLPDLTRRLSYPKPRQEQRLQQVEKEAIDKGLKERTERKVASIAVHTRGLTMDVAKRTEDELVQFWGKDVRQHGLECRRFNGGVEVRCIGIDKGTGLHNLLKNQPEGAFCVYVGDDETDEDAFRVIRGQGFGIRVGPLDVPTEAQGHLPDCRALLEFLKGWVHVTAAIKRG